MRFIRALPLALVAFAVGACSSDIPTDPLLQAAEREDLAAQTEHDLSVELCKTWLPAGPIPDVTWTFEISAEGADPFTRQVTRSSFPFPDETDVGKAGCIGSIGSWASGTELVITEILPPGYALDQVQAAPRGGGSNLVNPEGTNLTAASFTFLVDDYVRVWFKNVEGEDPVPALEVEKSAETYLTRSYRWEISKTADRSALDLAEGGTGSVEYTVVVSADPVESEWGVRGTLTITNPASVTATLESVADVVSGGIDAIVECGVSFPFDLSAGGTLECDYHAALPDAASRTNTATVTTSGEVPGGVGHADVEFGEGTEVMEVDTEVRVEDSRVGFLGIVAWNDGLEDRTFVYALSFGSSEGVDIEVACGESNHPNAATFETSDTGTTGWDEWSVKVDVGCTPVGCTRSPGYWQTHSEHGPAPYDGTWGALPGGADTPFFLSGDSHLGVMRTSPRGNVYYNLAFQYVAALLNGLSGADLGEVQSAFDRATEIFETFTPEQIGALRGNHALRQEILGTAGLLDRYNNGRIGPGTCDG